ncbi:MAG: hypothetical protein R2854_01060 [Caldilineaceae bacterium]
MRRLAPAWLTYGLLVSLGLLQLFFGYVENYSFAAVGVLAYLWLGLRVPAGASPLWLAATVLAVTNATHPSTIVLAPSLLYLGWQSRRGKQIVARRRLGSRRAHGAHRRGHVWPDGVRRSRAARPVDQ